MIFSLGRKSFWPQWLAGFTVSLAVLVTGLSNGWTSPLMAQLTSPNNTHPISLTDSEASWFASLLNLGRVSGAIIGATSQELFGRKRTLMLGTLPLAVGWLCFLIATSVPWLYTGRVLQGLASGVIWSALSLFVGEIADPTIRGSLILLNLNMTTIGAFLGNAMGPYLSMQLIACLCLGGTVVFLGLFSFVPDTPYRHIAKGDLVQAEKSLRWFKREADVKGELQELRDFVGTTNVTMATRYRELRSNPEHLKNLWMLFCLNALLYGTGYNAISYYLEIIVTRSGVVITPSTVVTALGFSSIIAGATAVILVDKFGRRSLLMASAAVTSFALVLLGGHFYMLEVNFFDPRLSTWLPIFALFLFNFGSFYGIVPVPNTLVSELFPPVIKTFAAMFFSSSSSIMAFTVAKCFQPYVDLVGEKYVFWTFATSAALFVAYAYYVVPETKGKSLVQIQRDLGEKNERGKEAEGKVKDTV